MPRSIGLASLLSLVAGCALWPALVPFDAPVTAARTILVATSRAGTEASPPRYGADPAATPGYGIYRVSVPPDRAPGDRGVPGVSPDPDRDILLTGYAPLADADALVASLDARLAPLPSDQRRVMLYVHGFFTRFDSAVLVAAQVADDYRFPGQVLSFSWPSAGLLTHYERDRAQAYHARLPLADLLRALTRSKATSIDILAHSMGAYLTMESLALLSAGGETAVLDRLSRVVLAAPDIDAQAFARQVVALGAARPELVVIGSARDIVLEASRILADGRHRLGAIPDFSQLRRLGVYAVDVGAFDPGTVAGHFAFHRSPELIAMIRSGDLARAQETGPAGATITLEAPRPGGGVARAIVHVP